MRQGMQQQQQPQRQQQQLSCCRQRLKHTILFQLRQLPPTHFKFNKTSSSSSNGSNGSDVTTVLMLKCNVESVLG